MSVLNDSREAVQTIRRFTTAVFIVHDGRVLMLFHKALQRWLPPGGKLLANELPQDCAIREVKEETGLDIVLLEDSSLPKIPAPTERLVQPFHMQLEKCPDGSENIDFIFHARLREAAEISDAQQELCVPFVEICEASERYEWMDLEALKEKVSELEVFENARWSLFNIDRGDDSV